MKSIGPESTQTDVCYSCHDGTGASSNILDGSDSFGQSSGHVLEQRHDGTADLTDRCSSCHAAHDDPTKRPKMPAATVNGVTVASAGAGWCLACHSDNRSWTATGYPEVFAPTRDATGYPVQGTFPGRDTYVDPTRNAHSQIPTSSPDESLGDCRQCHASHRGPNAYDELKLAFRPSTTSTVVDDRANGTYAASCFACHDGDAGWRAKGAVDIKSFVTTQAADTSAFAGHRVKTTGGILPNNAPLPCYDCHNPHGSTGGNKSEITDELGANLRTDNAQNVRRFCLTCHSSRDGKVWDSATSAYTAVSTTETVEGLRRDGTLRAGQTAPNGSTTNWLRLGSASEAHDSDDTESCYTCHGDDYTSGGSNVHDPSGTANTASASSKDCYDCHGTYQANMEDGSGAKVGTSRTDVYHHVLGGAGDDGDRPVSAGYPSSKTSVYCTSCHVGHSSETSAATMMRTSVESTGTSAIGSDYEPVSGGICISCHATSQPKDTDNQRSDGSTSTPVVRSGSSAGGFGASAHSYEVTSTMQDGSLFRSDCSKCHSTGLPSGDPAGVGVHWSENRRLLAALGATQSDPLHETRCFRCHSKVGDDIGGQTKPTAGKDWYGVQAMPTTGTESVFDAFSLTSKHPVYGSVGGAVQCSNCHNNHTVSASSPVSDPDNTYNAEPYDTPFQKTQFCLKCHDGVDLPSFRADDSVYIPWSVAISPLDAGIMNKGTYAGRGHDAITGTSSCGDCHDAHGSNAPDLLGVFDALSGTNKINGITVTANDKTVCYTCHGASTGAESRDTSGYPTAGTWPGSAVYNGADGIHNKATVWRPGTAFAGGDCKNCHDVHGTANEYDELVAQFSPTSFVECFECHDGSNPAGANIKQYYPTASGGSSSADSAGHATVTTGNLPAGSALPCYDCHNPHGSGSAKGLQVSVALSSTETTVVGDAAGEIDLSSNGGIRDFCLTCHTTADTAEGFDGSGLSAVSSGATVEGIDRVNASAKLRLPAVTGHNASSPDSCTDSTCHGSSGGTVHSLTAQP